MVSSKGSGSFPRPRFIPERQVWIQNGSPTPNAHFFEGMTWGFIMENPAFANTPQAKRLFGGDGKREWLRTEPSLANSSGIPVAFPQKTRVPSP